MHEAEIAALFIRAAETEMRMPRRGEKPAGYGGYVLPWVHEMGDINMRGIGFKKARSERDPEGDKLVYGDDPLNEWRWWWLDEAPLKNEQADVTLWETCIDWTARFIADERQRRALWAWAFAKAGGRTFKKWCLGIEHIAVVTGKRRCDRALASIAVGIARDGAVHNRNGQIRVLLDTPEIGDITDTVGSDAGKRQEPNFWSEDAAFKSFLPTYVKHTDGDTSVEDMQFSARAARNAQRRAKEAARRRAQREAEAA